MMGHEKGSDTESRIKHNFGMAKPEGYRKALRLMKTAERFQIPVVTLIDTPGAYPGIGAEERNQSEAIARNLFEMADLQTPIICTVIGEGGSGGALAIGVGDRVMMLEYMKWWEAADLIHKAFEKTIQQKTVTYDFARQMEGATEVSTSGFADALIERL